MMSHSMLTSWAKRIDMSRLRLNWKENWIAAQMAISKS